MSDKILLTREQVRTWIDAANTCGDDIYKVCEGIRNNLNINACTDIEQKDFDKVMAFLAAIKTRNDFYKISKKVNRLHETISTRQSDTIFYQLTDRGNDIFVKLHEAILSNFNVTELDNINKQDYKSCLKFLKELLKKEEYKEMMKKEKIAYIENIDKVGECGC